MFYSHYALSWTGTKVHFWYIIHFKYKKDSLVFPSLYRLRPLQLHETFLSIKFSISTILDKNRIFKSINKIFPSWLIISCLNVYWSVPIFSACAGANLTGCLHAHPVTVVTDGGGAPSHLDYSWHQHGQKVGGPLFGRRSVEWHGYSNDAAGLSCLGYSWYRHCDGAARMGWTAPRVSRGRARPA